MTMLDWTGWKMWVALILIVIGAVLLFIVLLVVVFAFYGAIFGTIGAAIYLTFKAIIGVLL